MTISTITPKPPANAGTRSERATLARMRAADLKSAAVLRDRGWTVIDPDHGPSLGVILAHFAHRHAITVDEAWAILGLEVPDAH